MMLTQEQRDTFRLALASFNNCGRAVDASAIDDMLTDAQIVETRDTIEDFFDARGRRLNRHGQRPETPYERESTAHGHIYVWRNQQAKPGLRRGDLYVMDMGDARACYFDGEQPR